MAAGPPPSGPVSGSKTLTFSQISFWTKPSEFELSDICHSPLPKLPKGHLCTRHPREGGWSRPLWATGVLTFV